MKKDLEYFKDFLDNPAAYKVAEFYSFVGEWAEYVSAHKSDFNYLEDEEWREIRERLIAAFEVKEGLKFEFEEIEERYDALREDGSDEERIAVFREILEFMKRNQFEYDFTGEQIAEGEAKLERIILSVRKCEISEENLRKSEIECREAVEKLDDSLAEHYEHTGKRPILTSLRRFKGN